MSVPASDTPVDDAAFAAEALRVADLAYDRVMAGIDPRLDAMPTALEPADAVRWIGDRVTELVAGFAELPLDRLVDLGATPPDADHRAAEQHGGAPLGEPLTLTSARGGVGEVRIWLHPLGELPTGTLTLRLGDLQPGAGEGLPGGTAVFVPPAIPLPVGAATSVLLRYPIPSDAVPGRYHGLVLAGGGGIDAVLPITVVVT